MPEDFMAGLCAKDRQVLVRMASGESDREIVAATDLPLPTVTSVIRSFQRWLRNHTSVARITREVMAFHIIDNVLTDDDRQLWLQRAQLDHQLLQRCNLLTDEVVRLLDQAVKPENWGATHDELALAAGVTTRKVREMLRPASDALGSHIRLQVGFYLLAVVR
ncbi:MAG TPA: hypothetical protein VM581_03845 [Magnetospirillaceae bacterium]|nr:hypothetical protein [Magnetospirillaceae bacterium]